jgi:hypothetical protein
MEGGVTLPTPPEGYKYKLVRDHGYKSDSKRPRVKDKDPSELTPRQLATLRYREKNKEKIAEQSRHKYQEKKKQKVSELGTTPS